MYFVTLHQVSQTVGHREEDIWLIWGVSSPISISVVTGISYSKTAKFTEYNQGQREVAEIIWITWDCRSWSTRDKSRWPATRSGRIWPSWSLCWCWDGNISGDNHSFSRESGRDPGRIILASGLSGGRNNYDSSYYRNYQLLLVVYLYSLWNKRFNCELVETNYIHCVSRSLFSNFGCECKQFLNGF